MGADRDTTAETEEAAAIAALDALGAADAPAEHDKAPARPKRSHSRKNAAPRAPRAATGAPRVRAAKRPNIAAGMAGFYTMAGLAVGMVPSGPAVAGPLAGETTITGAVGRSMVANSVALGTAWEQAAKDDPRIRAAIEKLMAVTMVGAIITAHLPVVMAGMLAAGAVPAEVVAGMGMLPEFVRHEPVDVLPHISRPYVAPDFPPVG